MSSSKDTANEFLDVRSSVEEPVGSGATHKQMYDLYKSLQISTFLCPFAVEPAFYNCFCLNGLCTEVLDEQQFTDTTIHNGYVSD